MQITQLATGDQVVLRVRRRGEVEVFIPPELPPADVLTLARLVLDTAEFDELQQAISEPDR
jgi:hypothetical protein